MELRNLGTSGLRVSVVGMGCNNFGGRIGAEESRAVVHKALDLGITLFDTADTYGNRGGSEEALGEVLGERRKDIVLATKFGMPMDDAKVLAGASRRYIMRPRKPRCGGCAPIGSISTSCIRPMPAPRSRRRCGRSTT